MSDHPNEIIPVLPYEDIRAAHDFLVDVLGFASGGLHETPDGHVVHGEVQAGSQRIWLHEATSGLTTPRRSGHVTGGTVVYVPDVDAHFERVKASGADVLREPADEDYGQREYGVADPEGHRWYIATPLPG